MMTRRTLFNSHPVMYDIMKHMLTFIIPCYNAAPNIHDLVQSLRAQSDTDWSALFIDDCSTDDTRDALKEAMASDGRIAVVLGSSRMYALYNIIHASRTIIANNDADRNIIAIIDGDDQLCNTETVRLVKDAHSQPDTVAWTAHRWDINDMNISREMPQNVNPYQWPWCSSHLRTFDARLLNSISDDNFKDNKGVWFQRGYDQALMLPLLTVAKVRKYIPDVCYLYRIRSCSVDDRDWAERKQLATVNLVRARGFLK